MVDFDKLLTETSRTFGLSIPLLEEPHRRQLTLAYLLFRVADTLEDADPLPRAVRVSGLDDLLEVLRTRDAHKCSLLSRQWLDWGPSAHTGYLDLLRDLPALLNAIENLGRPSSEIILEHACRTVQGMRAFTARSDDEGNLQLESLADLRGYCYEVAGIVGELITELLLDGFAALGPSADRLRRLSVTFGEGLQLVNILRDADDDARGGRIYLPAQVSRSEIEALARQDLVTAEAYVTRVQNAGVTHGVVPFLELPRRLALATLDRVREQGPGAKLTRGEVGQVLRQLHAQPGS